MQQIAYWSLHLAIACLFTHEIDAMSYHEWRLLPVLSWLPDAQAKQWFVLLHVPLFALLLAGLTSQLERLKLLVSYGLAAFCIVHGGLHWALSGSTAYEFQGWLAHGLIGAAAAFAAVHLLAKWWVWEKH